MDGDGMDGVWEWKGQRLNRAPPVSPSAAVQSALNALKDETHFE